MSKSRPTLEADTYRSPLLLPGDLVSECVGDRGNWVAGRPLHRSGGVAYMGGRHARQTVFALLFQIFRTLPTGNRRILVVPRETVTN